MKSLNLFALVVLVLAAIWLGQTEASFCPCNLREKGQVCGSNGVTYVNRCEFECTQRDYKKLGRALNIRNMGPC
ncbi:agrin [Drosophila grimshawi]|uniref:GH13810 n=1 Tax=Drosophila grimshawi TaxID=7222 RepID=B4JR37_DROGR|nr:agrin [Drosophila grimshawi]EDV99367.1 GH13810 [Drosophila grimshawi]